MGYFQPVPTNQLTNNNPGAGILTLPQIAQFTEQSPSNYISYWCFRNPTAVYNWMRQNYQFAPVIGNGLTITNNNINAMHDFLLTQYNILPASQQADWIYKLGHSMPDAAELTNNWTFPKSA